MMAAAIAFALWYSTAPTPPAVPALAGQAAELRANAGAYASAPAAQTGVIHELVVLKLVTPVIADAAGHWLSSVYHAPIGTQQRVVVDGRPLVFVLEWHYHPPGFVGGPSGKHKGVTVFEQR
jgi:hypothetical protein